MEEVAAIELGPTIRKPSSLLKAVENDDKGEVRHWLQWLKEGPERLWVVNDRDALGNTAAHLAAKLDRDEILNMLLSSKIGVDLNVRNNDALTPLHLACIKGHVKIVNLILHYAPAELKESILSAKDGHSNEPLQLAMLYGQEDVALAILNDNKELTTLGGNQQSSPLHLAAKYDLVNVIDYLLESGADIEGTNIELHTPLMAAVFSGCVNASMRFIEKGACTDGIDHFGRNIVHLAAEQDIVTVLEVVNSTFIRNACIAYDSSKSTPLHIAAAKGSLAVVELIMKESVSIDLKNSSGKTPLHVAAECGNTRIVQRFLSHRRFALNTQDEDGYTPLHLACQQRHSSVAEMLVKSGAMIHFKDKNGRTPLVTAVRSRSNEIVKLLSVAGAGSDVDHGEEDILSVAMNNGAGVDVALSLLAGGLISKTTNLCEPIKKIPALVEALLNKCIKGCTENDTLQKVHNEKKDCLFTLDFEPIGSFTSDDFEKESHPLSLMVEHKRLELLKHPVVKTLIKYKWKKYGQYLYLFNLCFYAIFLVFLTSFALVVLNPSHPICVQALSNVNTPLTCQGLSPSRSRFIRGAAFVIVFLVSVRIIFEIFQFLRLKLSYFKEVINLLEIVLYFSTLNFVWIFHSPCLCVIGKQWEFGVVAIFLGWFILTLFTDKLPLAGLYVLMFISILKTFLKTIVLSLLLIVSFGLAFFMLFHNPDISRSPFASPFISILKTITMSEGEFDFDTNFAIDQGGTTPNIAYPNTSFFLWLIFLILMSILLTNLLTGLAVDDVKGIQDNATLKRLKLKIDFLLAIDGFIYQFRDFIPNIIYQWLTSEDKITVLVYNKLSAWQKLQLSVLERDHDLLVSAQEFISITEDSAAKSMQECNEKRDLNLKMAELQEDTERIQLSQEKIGSQVKKTISDLETKVTELTNDNQEIKKYLSDLSKQNLELKQTILELCDYNHWQKDVISEIAKKLSFSSEDPNVSD